VHVVVIREFFDGSRKRGPRRLAVPPPCVLDNREAKQGNAVILLQNGLASRQAFFRFPPRASQILEKPTPLSAPVSGRNWGLCSSPTLAASQSQRVVSVISADGAEVQNNCPLLSDPVFGCLPQRLQSPDQSHHSFERHVRGRFKEVRWSGFLGHKVLQDC